MRSRLISSVLGAIAPLAMLAAPAAADVIDPQIVIQQSAGGVGAGAPNLITSPSTGFVTFVNGSDTLQNPLLLIIGTFDGNGGTPTLTYLGNPLSLAAVGTYGLTGNSGVSFTSGDAFAALGLSSGGSESFGNWACGPSNCPGTGGDAALGLTPTSFSLYAFAVPVNLTSTPITLDESGAPKGSYIIAYDCIDGTGTSIGCAEPDKTGTLKLKPGDIGQTVYTNTGLISGGGGGGGGGGNVPEPGTLFLLGSGLVGLGVIRRYRKRA